MSDPSKPREVIDVDDLDVFCVGVRRCVRVDRTPSPLSRKRHRERAISLVDSDSDDPLSVPVLQPNPSHSQSSLRPMHRYTELQRITQSELNLRTALLDTRPAKKRATDAIKMAINAVKNHNELKRKERSSEVIEISSDSEPEIWPTKRPKVEEHAAPSCNTDDEPKYTPKPETDLSRPGLRSPSLSDPHYSDDDDDEDESLQCLASLDISNEANWVPLPKRNKAEDLTPNLLDVDMSKPEPLPPFCLPRKKPPIDYRHVPLDWPSLGLWGALSRNYGTTKFPKPFHHARRQEHLWPRRPPNLHYEQGFTKLELIAKYPHLTSGPVNRIIQAQDTVVLCSAVEGGLEDSDEDEDSLPPPENKSGSLVVYHHGQVHVTPAHCRPRETTRGLVTKYYTINDVTFDPRNPKQFLSSGCDLIVQVWKILDPDDNDGHGGLGALRQFRLDSRPQDLVYAPDDPERPALAITCHDGTVWMYNQDLFEDMDIDECPPSKRYQVAPKGLDHATGSVVWGQGPSKGLLFTSSEPTEDNDHSGFHHAFDISKGVQAIQFDATEAGDAAILSTDGTTLVLFTSGRDSTHPIRLYDVRRKVKEAYETEELEKFRVRPSQNPNRPSDSEEVNQASFCPDGRLFAVARSDNALHVYDVRALSRGPLCRFEHHDSDAVDGGGFGIVTAEWIQRRDRLGILSGGNDGCVRLWEPALANTSDVQGTVIGRTDFDVASFSIGDRQKGEFPLIIGDSGGGMHTYGFTNEDGIRI